MELKNFIGKTVVDTKNQKRYTLYEISSPVIEVAALQPNAYGTRTIYHYPTINGDPISTGVLSFEDASLLEPFKEIYAAHCRSESGRMEEYGYWMRMA